MRRTLVVAPALLLALLVAGCGDKGTQNVSGSVTAPSQSATRTAIPPARDGSATVDEQEFCDNIVAVFSPGTSQHDPLNDLLSDGVPAEMPAAAKDGVQVLLDHAGQVTDPKAALEAYRALSEREQSAVHSLVGYVVTACGTEIVKSLAERLPESVPDELKSLRPEDLPSDLRDLLPSQLPSALVGVIPPELAELIPEEWRSLVPEEYRGIFAPTPSASATP